MKTNRRLCGQNNEKYRNKATYTDEGHGKAKKINKAKEKTKQTMKKKSQKGREAKREEFREEGRKKNMNLIVLVLRTDQ